MNKRVICKSGVTGWQGHLQDQYDSFESFRDADEYYGIAAKLGFPPDVYDARDCWDANPLMQASTVPEDCCRVLEPKDVPVHIKVIVELQVDACDSADVIPEWVIRQAVEQAMQNIIEHGEQAGFVHDAAERLSIGLVAVEAAANELTGVSNV